MNKTEINEKNNFDTWEVEILHELKTELFSDAFGSFLFENDTIKLWNLTLKPFGRIPFGRRKYNYSLTCMTDGLALIRNANGQIDLVRLKKGDTPHCDLEGVESICDFQNLGEKVLKLIVMEHKPIT